MFGLTGYTADFLALAVMLLGAGFLIRDIHRVVQKNHRKTFHPVMKSGVGAGQKIR